MAPSVAVAAILVLTSSRLAAGSRVGVVLRPTGTVWPLARRSRCRSVHARARTPIGDTARQLSQRPVELANKLQQQVGFNRPAMLNVLVPLNPRHFSDAVNEDLASARARCVDCTCGYSEQRGGYSLCNSARERRNAQKGWLSRSATTLYFALWYLLSIGHSVTGKQLTNVLPLPVSIAAAQIVVGALFALCLWLTGLRSPPTGTLGGMARDLSVFRPNPRPRRNATPHCPSPHPKPHFSKPACLPLRCPRPRRATCPCSPGFCPSAPSMPWGTSPASSARARARSPSRRS